MQNNIATQHDTSTGGQTDFIIDSDDTPILITYRIKLIDELVPSSIISQTFILFAKYAPLTSYIVRDDAVLRTLSPSTLITHVLPVEIIDKD